jgi:hypothetical protein
MPIANQRPKPSDRTATGLFPGPLSHAPASQLSPTLLRRTPRSPAPAALVPFTPRSPHTPLYLLSPSLEGHTASTFTAFGVSTAEAQQAAAGPGMDLDAIQVRCWRVCCAL